MHDSATSTVLFRWQEWLLPIHRCTSSQEPLSSKAKIPTPQGSDTLSAGLGVLTSWMQNPGFLNFDLSLSCVQACIVKYVRGALTCHVDIYNFSEFVNVSVRLYVPVDHALRGGAVTHAFPTRCTPPNHHEEHPVSEDLFAVVTMCPLPVWQPLSISVSISEPSLSPSCTSSLKGLQDAVHSRRSCACQRAPTRPQQRFSVRGKIGSTCTDFGACSHVCVFLLLTAVFVSRDGIAPEDKSY